MSVPFSKQTKKIKPVPRTVTRFWVGYRKVNQLFSWVLCINTEKGGSNRNPFQIDGREYKILWQRGSGPLLWVLFVTVRSKRVWT